MAATASTMLPLGSGAPDFDLPDSTGHLVSSRDFAGSRALLVMFLCNHCPYVKHVAEEVVRVAKEYQARGVGVVAISSNDVAQYPDDGPGRMAQVATAMGFTFPYLYDETQEVAKAYHAACTPDFFLFDADRRLVYRGQLDGARPGNGVPVSGRDLRAALDAVLASNPVPEPQLPSLGCNIKWKPGSEPGYFMLGHGSVRS
ncbi:MAG: thioredoxin family protein [Candidatus Limnocylindrales bacterium]|jgi:peroxiredoxin